MSNKWITKLDDIETEIRMLISQFRNTTERLEALRKDLERTKTLMCIESKSEEGAEQ